MALGNCCSLWLSPATSAHSQSVGFYLHWDFIEDLGRALMVGADMVHSLQREKVYMVRNHSRSSNDCRVGGRGQGHCSPRQAWGKDLRRQEAAG